MSIANVVGVQFRRAGKIYDFSPGEFVLKVGDQIVVDTERGPTVAKVVKVSAMDVSKGSFGQLKTVMRMAGERDLSEEGQFSESQMMDIARGRVESFKLDMRIMKAEAQMGGNKVMLYFSSPGRVDFRDLVKDLAGALRSRVELKQVGARDEAKLVGGLGICGREYCCSSFLRDFVPVSIKMAKNQNLALNPSKVSGGCGRLLCCLTYENDAYLDLRRKLPALKSRVRHSHDGDVGLVLKTDILNQNVVFETADGRLLTAKAKDLESIDKHDMPKDQLDSEADMWAEDIDLGLLMNESEDKTRGSDGRQQHGGGQQQRRDHERRDRDGGERRQEGSSGRRHQGHPDRRNDKDRSQPQSGGPPRDRKGRGPSGKN